MEKECLFNLSLLGFLFKEQLLARNKQLTLIVTYLTGFQSKLLN